MVYQRGSRLIASSENCGEVRVSIGDALANKSTDTAREEVVQERKERRGERGDEKDENRVPDRRTRLWPHYVLQFCAHILKIGEE